MSTKAAFEYMISVQGKNRVGYIYSGITKPVNALPIFLAPSNYGTQPGEIESIVGRGRQFVVMASQTSAALLRAPKRGDIVEDPYLGVTTVTMVKELPDIGGGIIGYRLTVE